MYIFLMPLLIVILLSLPAVNAIRKSQTGKKAKNALLFNVGTFFGVLLLATILPIGTLVSAESGAAVAAVSGTSAGLGYIAAALAVGLGSIGCGIAVAAAAPAAIGAVSEEPKAFSKALIFVALGEGVALYGFLIAFMILGKL